MNQARHLIRAVGLPGAVMMGLGSIVGTGVFVSLGLAAGIAGPAMILALLLAGILAVCNGLSSAQLAAAHPVSGGTYEYGYKYVNGWAGYLAGWLFVCAKSASAATAALGFGGYFIKLLNLDFIAAWQVGLLVAALVVLVAALGIKRSNLTNIVIVSITLVTLGVYVVTSIPQFHIDNFRPVFQNFANDKNTFPSFFEATALMFVAYTGYGRVATLGEEIIDPVRNIPKAIIATLAISFVVYMLVAITSIGAVGAEVFFIGTIEDVAPLQVISESIHNPIVAVVLSLGAMTAMLGVLLNLILGLSRVIFAMGRKGDLPSFFAHVGAADHTPIVAVLTSGAVIMSLVLLKDIKIAWSFSAFTVLIYYAITNISALRLPADKRLYPRMFTWLGLLGCLSLGFWVEGEALVLGFMVLLAGVAWRVIYQRCRR